MAKNILVIGGSSGIGLATTKILLQEKNNLYVASRTDRNNLPDGVNFSMLDATENEPDLTFLPDQLDGLIYAPGSINLKPFHRTRTEDFVQDFDLNVLGAVRIIQSSLPRLKKSSSAAIVLFSTVAVKQGMPFHSITGTVKSAVEGLGRSLAAELAPNIRVNVIAPSITDTPMASRLLSTPEKKEASAGRHPLKMVGEAEDIAQTAAFLVSDKSRWITGQVIHVDGGMSSIRS